MPKLPEVHFGSVDRGPLDWRKYKDESLDDDEPLEKTPKSVIEILGFDPLEFEGEK